MKYKSAIAILMLAVSGCSVPVKPTITSVPMKQVVQHAPEAMLMPPMPVAAPASAGVVETNYTVYFIVTAQNAFAESLPSNEASYTGTNQVLTLLWDPSPSLDVTNYVLYWGTASGTYSWHMNVGNVTNATWRAVPLAPTNVIISWSSGNLLELMRTDDMSQPMVAFTNSKPPVTLPIVNRQEFYTASERLYIKAE